jgi:hypothetical protein
LLVLAEKSCAIRMSGVLLMVGDTMLPDKWFISLLL